MLIQEFMVNDLELFIQLIIIHLYHLNHVLMTFFILIYNNILKKERNQLKKYEIFIDNRLY